MKTKNFAILFLSLLLGSCSVDWNDENTEFQNKQKCITYKGSLQEDIDKRTKDYNLTYENKQQKYIEEIIEILYSKKHNTCYAITSTASFSLLQQNWVATLSKIDLLGGTTEEIEKKNGYHQYSIDNNIVRDKIKELKGE